mmetsp:Transcript_16650/g.52437  ORF Transcript_16650/g.52437 Transcript_16650/m.52437 type:complete len:257 (-) Transcript_16650:631-1401(-)
MSCSSPRTLSASRKRFCCSRLSSSRAFRSWRKACWCMVSRNSILCCCASTSCRKLCTSSPVPSAEAPPSPQRLSSAPKVPIEAALCMPGAPDSEATLEASASAAVAEPGDAADPTAGVADPCAVSASATGPCGLAAVLRPAPAPSKGPAAARVAPEPALVPAAAPVPATAPMLERRREGWEPALEGRSGSGGRVRGGVALREGTGLCTSLPGLWHRAGLVARPMALWAEVRMSSSSCSKRRRRASSSRLLRSSFSW